MTWVKLDDQFFSHPKAREAGKDACLLHLAGLTYCGRHLTDGKIPKSAVDVIAAEAWSKTSCASRLVAVGFWHDGGDHYVVHDYLDHNPSRESVLSQREKRAAAGRKGAANRWHTEPEDDGNGDGKPDGKCHSSPHDDRIGDRIDTDHAPIPSPQDIPPKSPPGVSDADFEDWWKPWPKKVDKAEARARYRARRKAGCSHDDLCRARDNYVGTVNDPRYCKNGSTFLAPETWIEWLEAAPAVNGTARACDAEILFGGRK